MRFYRHWDGPWVACYWVATATTVLIACGCRSMGTGVPGMGWLAKSNRANNVAPAELDPTITLPAPSSVETPQTLVDAQQSTNKSSATEPSHQTVSYDATQTTASSGPPANYPSTGYPQIAPAAGGHRLADNPPLAPRPAPNPIAPSEPTTPSMTSQGGDYVQRGPYATSTAPPTAATTWDGRGAPANPLAAANNQQSIYGSVGAAPPPASINASPPAVHHEPSSMYGTQPTAPASADPLPAGPPPASASTVAQASYTESTTEPPSHYHNMASDQGRGAEHGGGQPWRPGSTADYMLR